MLLQLTAVKLVTYNRNAVIAAQQELLLCHHAAAMYSCTVAIDSAMLNIQVTLSMDCVLVMYKVTVMRHGADCTSHNLACQYNVQHYQYIQLIIIDSSAKLLNLQCYPQV